MEKKKKKSKKKTKRYFNQVHQDAILEYNKTTDVKKRNELYITLIKPAFKEMVEKIVYKFKFTSLPNIQDLIQECEGFLVTILDKYDVSKGHMAFSYYSVITKNWFSNKGKKFSQQIKKEKMHEEVSKEVEIDYLSTENPYIKDRINDEFFKQLWEEINSWENLNLKPNEKKVLHAIKTLLSKPEATNIFNKKAVYLDMREITDLNTKQILNNLNKFRNLYKDFKYRWDNEDI